MTDDRTPEQRRVDYQAARAAHTAEFFRDPPPPERDQAKAITARKAGTSRREGRAPP